MTITWKQYSEGQNRDIKAFRKKTANTHSQAEVMVLAAKSARRDGRPYYVVPTYSGFRISDSQPTAGVPGFIFEADRWGKF